MVVLCLFIVCGCCGCVFRVCNVCKGECVYLFVLCAHPCVYVDECVCLVHTLVCESYPPTTPLTPTHPPSHPGNRASWIQKTLPHSNGSNTLGFTTTRCDWYSRNRKWKNSSICAAHVVLYHEATCDEGYVDGGVWVC